MLSNKFFSIYMFCVFLLFSSSCTKKSLPDTPVGVMEAYINIAMTVKNPDDKQRLMELTMDEAHADLQKMNDKDFQSSFQQAQLHFKEFKTKDLREENDGSLSLIYELSYESKSEGVPALITNKKIAYLGKNNEGHWKIKSTKNIKSLVERKEALDVTKP